MGKIVHVTEETLFPRLDENHYETAIRMLDRIRDDHPEFDEGYLWSLRMEASDDNRMRVRITVTDPRATTFSIELAFLVFIIIVSISLLVV